MINVSGLLTLISFCGLFILICGSTFGIGLRLILKHVGINNRFALFFYALLLALLAFEFMLIGSALDPRVVVLNWKYILTTSAYTGIVAFFGVIVITLLYFLLFKIIRWIYGVVTNIFKNQKPTR
jgi:hypothetical protein